MSTVITLVSQTLTMFLLAAVGYLLFRRGKITPDGNKVLGRRWFICCCYFTRKNKN